MSQQIVTDRRDNGSLAVWAWLFALLTLGYLLPWAIAVSRGKSNSTAILAVNILVGWTFIGWIVALVMACGSHQMAGMVAAPPTTPNLTLTREGLLDVVGESNYEASFGRLFTKAELNVMGGTEKYVQGSLVREPRNAFDSNAVRVDAQGLVVGYLPRESAAHYAAWLDSIGGRAEFEVRLWARNDGARIFGSASVLLPSGE